jgi:hypothetical protein
MMTAKRLNAYYGPLHDAFRQFVLLNGVLFQFLNHAKRRSSEIERTLGRRRGKTPEFFAHASLVIRDLTVSEADGWPLTFPIGGHTRQGRPYLRTLDDIVARESAWTVVLGFEAFETYANDLAAVYLKRNPAELGAPHWVKRRNKDADMGRTSSIADYRVFVRRAFRGAEDLTKRLSASLGELAHAESYNNRCLDLRTWLHAAAEVRHATVHSRAVVPHARLSKLGPVRAKLLQSHFPGRMSADGYRLRLDGSTADEAIVFLAEYAFLMFKSASRHDKLDHEVYRTISISV